MDKKQAQALIKETFESTFDKSRFVGFVKNLLNDVEEATFMYKGNYIPDAYEQYINTLERIGKYTDGEHKIDILIAKLKKETSIERARTMQRNFVAWYLNGSRGGELKDAALVAFVAPNDEDWRFSLVKMDYRFEEGKKGRMRVKEEFTPARRWSFLVGINENSHTAQSQLVDLVADDERNPVLAQLEESFNIEKVTKEFFEKYRDLFLWTKETLDDTIKKDKKIREDFETNGVDTVDFSKKLLGQIVFLYFLQKKGWFGVRRDADWGTGPKNFLRELFESKHGTYKNFFNDILEPLFYEALARERDDDFYSRFNCKIPFLNGGLFDPINNYDWVHTDILLPNELFSNNFKTKEGDKGTGILDIFDRYNFTVKEDEPLEKEVAVDPEMLGKVFENLLEVKDRKSKGTYYTPREIVHYMCQQSLINYLVTELEGKVRKEDIETLVKYGEQLGENETIVEAKGRETSTYFYKLPESIRQNAELIDKKLIDIKVCDPAIGSGAFPVGMMGEIVRTRNTLTSYIKNADRTLYNFKRDCIHNSLYGVDIDPSAVEIAKLRLWLSLVVDEGDIRQIKPLPNLDYKIMQGNSLLEEYEGVLLFDDKLISTIDFSKEKQMSDLKEKQAKLSSEYIRLHQADKLTRDKKQQIDEEFKKINAQIKRLEQSGKKVEENTSLFDVYNTAKKKSDDLKRLHKEFFETTQKTKKDELKKQIERLEWDLIETTLREQNKISELKKLEVLKKANVKPFFLWKLHFSDVFQEKGGFDVMIANPPYVNVFELDKDESFDKNIYRGKYSSAVGAFDIYVLFHELCTVLAKSNGFVTLISPNKFLSAEYAKSLRSYLMENVVFINLLDLSKMRVFDASVYPVVSIYKKCISDRSIKIFRGEGDVGNVNIIEVGEFQQNIIKNSPDLMWSFLLNGEPGIYYKINSYPKISSVCDITASFSVDESYKMKKVIFEKENVRATEKYKKLLISSNVHRYYQTWGNSTISYLKLRFKRPVVILDRKVLSEHRISQINSQKIIIAGMTKEIRAFPDIDAEFAGGIPTVLLTNIKIDIKYLVSLLNSKLYTYYFHLLFGSLSLAGGYLRIGVPQISQLPFVKLNGNTEVKMFISLVDKIMSITNNDDYLMNTKKQTKVQEYERQIDQMVYELYDLTKKEIKIVEEFGKES